MSFGRTEIKPELLPEHWLQKHDFGLYCRPANTYIDPMRPSANAIVTHGHADHARSGHGKVYATEETLAIMAVRYGSEHAEQTRALAYGEAMDIGGGVTLTLMPAGHILGSAQAVLNYQGQTVVVSGDYKRRPDATCPAFEPVSCDVFITEATFALPVFTFPEPQQEVQKLLRSMAMFPERCHMVGVYALGKCQTLLCELRKAGYTKPVYLHGALVKMCQVYQQFGVDLGELIPVSQTDKKQLRGELVLAPPSALADRWSRAFPNTLTAMASGWMHIRARAKQRLVELPLVISDHADWPEILQTIEDVRAPEIWVTHGRESALIHQLGNMGLRGRALSLIGYDEDA